MEESIEVVAGAVEGSENLSRREALNLGWLALFTAVSAGVGIYYKKDEIISAVESFGEAATSSGVFDVDHLGEKVPLNLYSLDYIERLSPSPRPAFLAYENGHRRYLRNVVLNSPYIKRNIAISLNRMLWNPETNPTLGGLLEEHILLAREALKESEPDFNNISADMQFYQCLTMATYSLTAILGAWINMSEFKDMGVIFPAEFQSTDRHGISPTYQLWKLFPKIFPVLVDKGIEKDSYAGLFFGSGADRSVHLMNHFFLVSRYMTLLHSGNQDVERIPEFVKVILTPFSGALRAKALSLLAGLGWEFKETVKDKDVVGNFEKQPGFIDPVVSLDLEANKTGASLAVETLLYVSTNRTADFNSLLLDIREVFSKLEEPYYTQPRKLLRRVPILDFYYAQDLIGG